MQNAVWAYKNTMGLFRYGQYLLLVTGAINLVLDFVFGYQWGMFGIFLASAVSRILTNVWYDPYAVYKYGLKMNPINYFKKYLQYALTLSFTTLVCYLMCNLFTFNIFINVILKLIVCSLVPNVMFFIFYHNTNEGKYLVSATKRIINRVLKFF